MDRPIAVFDSGIGGLTVLKEIINILPNERYIYMADNAFFPYGTKSFEQLEIRLRKVVHQLLSFDVKAIVVACNTASLHIKSMAKLAKIPVIDVILPTCNKVIQTTRNKEVCLLATDATVKAGRYQHILSKGGIDMISIACSDFVPLAESGVYLTPQADSIVRHKLQKYACLSFDTVILGCTHFGLLKDQICNVLKRRCYVECAESTAYRLQSVLQQKDLLRSDSVGDVRMLATGGDEVFERATRHFQLDFVWQKVVRIY